MNNHKILLSLKNNKIIREKTQLNNKELKNHLKIYLIRHGNATNNIGIRSQDSKLTQLGVNQAISRQHFFKDIHFDNIYCSPLSRCIQTSNYALSNRTILLNDLLMEKAHSICDERLEINNLKYYTESFLSNNKYILDNINPDYVFNQENPTDVEIRVMYFFDYLIRSNKSGGQVLICSHAEWLYIFLNIIDPNLIENTFNNCEIKIINLQI